MSAEQPAGPRIFIDADACPVKTEALRVAERHRLHVFVVSNGGIRPSPDPLVQTVIVPEGADAADRWIAEQIGAGDLCITSDIPLASRAVEAGAVVLKPNGEVLNAANVGQALAMRDLMTDLRAANPLGTGGGAKPFGKADRSRFLDRLEREIQRLRRPRR